MMNSKNKICFLDQIRKKQGNEKLIKYFNNLAKINSEKACKLINHEDLYFTSLYLLKNVILENGLFKNINSRNRIAIETINEIQERRINKKYRKHLSVKKNNNYLSFFVMKWIFETGWRDDGLNNDFDDVLDTVAILLVKVHRDTSILPILSTMIFQRNRKKTFFHDLLWALYESKEPGVLIFVAQGLLSKNPEDINLAKRLLSFIPGIENSTSNSKAYMYFLYWFNENKSFLQYSGESFQLTSRPMPFKVKKEAKYLCKPVSVKNNTFINELSEIEKNLLDEFNSLNEKEKDLLSRYSLMLFFTNLNQWKMWMNQPISKQLKIVKNAVGDIW